tara:strand:- start:114 stop:488 length:375 start_codon:yes stop_codon:yes gene_type:complete
MKKDSKKNYSISRKLKLESRIDEDFIIKLNSLSLEDIIALKLELSTKIFKGKFYGLQLYKYIPEIAKDAVVKYAIAATNSKINASYILGISYRYLKYLQKGKEYERYFDTTPLTDQPIDDTLGL